jgi:RecB family exonuclease|tara:strand:+ start:296 stop:1126 length:831 start_codon:yes stop_codon:yes gene_type:complete
LNKKKQLTFIDPRFSIFSYSQIATFQTCREQFRIIYLDGKRKKDESIEAFMGKCVHETLEWLYKKENMLKPYITFDKLCKIYDNTWQDKWHDKIYIVDHNLESNHFYATGKRCLSNYYHRYGPIFDQKVYATELALDFQIDNYQFKGIIDRLDQPKKGSWVIHDYKSGKRAMTQNMAKRDLQLALYQIAVEQNFGPVEKISLTWHFLRNGVEMTITHTQEEISKFKNTLSKRVKQIINLSSNIENLYPKESILCNWCYFWDECSAKVSSNPSKRAY